MNSKNVSKLYLITTLFSLGPDYALAKTQSHSEMSSLQTFNSSIDGIKALSAKLSPHDESMKTLLLTHEEKNAVLKNIDSVLDKKNKAIFEYMKLTKSLNSKIEKLSFSQRVKGEFQKRELSSNIDDQEQEVSELKGLIVQKDLKIQFLKKSIKNQTIQLSQKIQKLNFKIKNLTDSFNEMPKEMEKVALLTQSKHIEEIRGLQNQLHMKNMTIVSYQDQLKKYQDLEDVATGNNQLAQQLKKSNQQLENYKVSYKELEKKLEAEIGKNSQLKTYAENIKAEYSNHINLLQQKYGAAIEKVNSIESKYLAQGSRMPASVVNYEPVKSNVDLGYLVEVDPSHLKIILDESFFFKTGESELSEESKMKLQTIMSAYSEQIFTKDKLRERLENIHIIGHSSPLFEGKYVDPTLASKRAYQFNMEISLQRAKSIVAIMIDENTNLPHKNEIRSKLIISGKSFSEPRPLPRGPASLSQMKCGDFDCPSSQRVEIIFELQKAD
ncbi:OmpA family protein [Halobacteriovorax sp. JY17]|uniref:OmpA family protein n=1 Tax=Halobacteriovorax sp. JY17 TaxID=2014617 RepID=UPI000C43A5B3|nr:OmpA family protein [Halobacteriovorax sp. JY17]PIK16659.1 MAG: hypothetical protein CES88_07915 [Halobacteriovorax sp. JY17]